MTEAPPPPPGHEQPTGYQPPAGFAPPKHPQATTVLVLGILGLVLCGVLAPFAWVMGDKAQKEMLASPGAFSGEGEVKAGRVLGIIGTAILALGLLVIAVGLAGLIVYSSTEG